MAKKAKQPAIIAEQEKLGAYRQDEIAWFFDPKTKRYIRHVRMGADLMWEEVGSAELTEEEVTILHNQKRSNKMSFDENEGSVFTPDFSDTHDEMTLADGTEAHLQCKYVNVGTDKNGSPYWQLSYEVIDEPFAKLVRHFMSFPGPNDDPRKKNTKMLNLRTFIRAHGLSEGQPLVANDMVGIECWAILKLKEDEEYGDSNEIKKFLNAK